MWPRGGFERQCRLGSRTYVEGQRGTRTLVPSLEPRVLLSRQPVPVSSARGRPLRVLGAPQVAAGQRPWAGAGRRGVLWVSVPTWMLQAHVCPPRGCADSRLREEASERKQRFSECVLGTLQGTREVQTT